MRKKVAVVGSGISGLYCAYLLQRQFDVVLIEAEDRLGGHTNTVRVKDPVLGDIGIDTGFIVFNDLNYPVFSSFLDQLGVDAVASDMSFGFYDPRELFWYCSDVPTGLFSQPERVFSPRYWRFLSEIVFFNRRVRRDLVRRSTNLMALTLGDYVATLGVSDYFLDRYLYPMGAAIWSCPVGTIQSFPAYAFFSFWENHRLLSLVNRPQWRTVQGGSRSYIDAFLTQFSGQVQLGFPVEKIDNRSGEVQVCSRDGRVITADAVVVATHADQALSLLATPTPLEHQLLSAWTYSPNTVTLHTDVSVMPPKRSAWASWMVQHPDSSTDTNGTSSGHDSLVMTYYMNRLQSIDSPVSYFVSLNSDAFIRPDQKLATIHYTHPVYTPASILAQSLLPNLNIQSPSQTVFFCGSYFGYGFHEDGAVSGRNAAAILGGIYG